MRVVYWILAGTILGSIAGLVSAIFLTGITASGLQYGRAIEIGGWSSDWTIGTNGTNRYVRAWVARHGLLAMRKREAVYFIRATDDSGQPLREDCHYDVSGGALPAQWWSITLYDRLGYLPRNTDAHLSVDSSDTALEDWAFEVSATPPLSDTLWVSSRRGEAFDLTLRLYRPDPDFLSNPSRYGAFPSVRRLACRGDEPA